MYTSKKKCKFNSDDIVWFNTKSNFSLIITSDEPFAYIKECLFSFYSLSDDELATIFILKLQLDE